MNKLHFILFSLIIIIVLYSPLMGQQGTSRRAAGGDLYKLMGKVVDVEKNGLVYASTRLFKIQDSSMVTGSVTDAKGVFEIEAPAGDYFLEISFLGYERLIISDILLDEQHPFKRLKDIQLREKETTLNEVEIAAKKSRMEFALDKKVFNVGQDLSSNGGTAADLLDNIPSVTVDIDGNVAVRGNTGVRLLINGKPSGFTNINSADALQQLSANMIEKVEIITNPSSRYEAEGTAGILNIVLKKERKQGWNGTFDLTGGAPHSHNASVNINHRRDKLNFFSGIGIRYRKQPRVSFEHRENWQSDSLLIQDQDSKSYRGGFSGNFSFGADYSFDKYTTLTASLRYRKSLDFNTGRIDYLTYNSAYDQLLGIDIRETEEDEIDNSLDYNLSFERNFARKGQKLTADFIYSNGGETEAMDAVEQAHNANRVPLASPSLQQQINNSENQEEITLKADYVHPFRKDGKFEAGYRGSKRDIDTDYLVEEFNNELNSWENRTDISNDFSYDEEIHAAYMSVGDKLNKFSYQLGLRAEYTHIKTLLVNTNEGNDKEYANLFPSAFFSYEVKTGNAIQLSYSRRLRRPRFWDLNPFFGFSNPRSFRAGNPDLDPEFAHSLEMSYIKYWDKATLSSSIYYRHTDGDIQRITVLLEDNISVSRPQNVATKDEIGLEFSLNYTPLKWWDLTLSSNVYQGKINGANLGFARQTEFFSFTSRLNSKMSLPKDFDAQIMVNYRGPENSPQGRRRAILYTDVGINKDILNKKATIGIRVSDIFNTTWYRYETFGEDFYIYREGQWRSRRQGYLTFSYRLNQNKKRKRQRNQNFDDMGDM